MERSYGSIREEFARQRAAAIFGKDYTRPFTVRSIQDLVDLLPDSAHALGRFQGQRADSRVKARTAERVAGKVRTIPQMLLASIQEELQVCPSLGTPI